MLKTQMMKKIGLALGGGGARGCAHIGVIKALQEAEIPIQYVAGTSIGAFVGGVFAVGELERLENYLLKVKWSDVLSFFDPALMKSGMFKGKKLEKWIEKMTVKKNFKDCQMPFTAVATDLPTGKEVHLRKGSLSEAIRASVALPGIFTAVKKEDQYLLDGFIVNPLPVNVVRKMGADIVVAIDLNKEYYKQKQHQKHKESKNNERWLKRGYPNIFDVMEGSIFLMQNTLTSKNLEKHPADILLNLKLTPSNLFDFHKAKDLIKEGYQATQKIIPKLKKMLN